MTRLFAALAVGPLLAGCVYIGAGVGSGNFADHKPSGEAVYAVEIAKDALLVRVASNGCTKNDSFDVDVDGHGANFFVVRLERKKADPCKAYLPDGVSLAFAFQDLGIPEGGLVRLANPLRGR